MPIQWKLRTVNILMVDDDAEDCSLVQSIFNDGGHGHDFQHVENVDQLMDYLHRRGNYAGRTKSLFPSLILLDINLPTKSGWEALDEIKRNIDLRRIPVVILTTSSSPDDVQLSYDRGAASYITKPSRYQDWKSAIDTLDTYWFSTVRLPDGDKKD